MDNKALIQGTVIEDMVNKYFPHYGNPSKHDEYKIKASIRYFKKCSVKAENIKNRIIGALFNWLGKNNRTALKQMKEDGVISVEMYNAWEKTRQPLAHGKLLTVDNDDVKIQLFYSDMMATLSLFYRLLLLAINYKGKYINYSKIGYPEEEM
jgi:hypothetical protein